MTLIILSTTQKVEISSNRVESPTTIWKEWTSMITLQLLNTLKKKNTQKVWIHHNSKSNGNPVLENTSYKKRALGWSIYKDLHSE